MNDKISISAMGGLGNILFETACIYAYSLRYDMEPKLYIDTHVNTHSNINVYIDNVLSKVNLCKGSNSRIKIYQEPFFNYIPIPNFNESLHLVGYFQSEKYFKDYENEIRELFSYNVDIENETQKLLKYKNTCSIHVRRGDYLKYPDIHPVQSMGYYMESIKEFPSDTKFLIFSDDMVWCENNFPNESNFYFMEGNKDYEDLYIMSKCKNNIIANSSFSWWGAWLNGNKYKKVIAPKLWFGHKLKTNNTTDLYSEDWILI